MKLSEYTYNLPKDSIAIFPPKNRGDSRLLVLDKKTGQLEDSRYAHLDDYLNPQDLLLLNNTRVIKARLRAETASGRTREILLLEQHGETYNPHSATVMYRGRLSVGQKLKVGEAEVEIVELFDNGTARIISAHDIMGLAESYGGVPLPPYLRRDSTSEDIDRYQTVFAKSAGSVAAPTASLNLTPDLICRITAKGVAVKELTLHVGLGTFMPIREDRVEDHKMHSEYYSIPADVVAAIIATKQKGGRVVALGTTVARALEGAASKISVESNQYSGGISGEVDIFIYPGYQFQIVDALLTNFHAPGSTVLMMAAAFASWDHLLRAYEHAIHASYKLLSYGDSMFIK